MNTEEQIGSEVNNFVLKVFKKIQKLDADHMIEEATINPFLVKALGINDFDSLSRFYVYQHLGRSLVTSFGMSVMEKLVKSMKLSQRGDWWDISALPHNGKKYYISIKSGPRDMDYDQVNEFCRRARELLAVEPEAVPLIAMCYGKKPLGPIPSTLEKNGFDPKKTTLTGKELFETLSGQENFHEKLLEIVEQAAIDSLGGNKVIEMIDFKIKEIAESFKSKYKTVDDLLKDIF